MFTTLRTIKRSIRRLASILRFKERQPWVAKVRRKHPDLLDRALQEMLDGKVEDRKAAFSLAAHARLPLPEKKVLTLLRGPEEAGLGSAARYALKMDLPGALGILVGRLTSLDDTGLVHGVVEAICNRSLVEHLPLLESLWESHIADWPLVRSKVEQLRAGAIPLEEVRTAPFPDRNAGCYVAAGRGQSPLPDPDAAGPACPVCGEALVGLLRIPPAIAPEAAAQGLVLFHCPNCIFHDPLHFRFEDAPTLLGSGEGETLEKDGRSPVSPGAIRWSADPGPGDGEPETLLGGAPAWVQEEDTPACPKCEREMVFLLQLASDPTDLTGVDLGYSATVYLHWCAPCRVTAQTYQVD